MFHKKIVKKEYDQKNLVPVIRCSICTGEQVAGFKDLHTGKFKEIMVLKSHKDLDAFMKMYGLDSVSKEY